MHELRHLLFLQGMPCPFFRELAQLLVRDGVATTGISLCAGDRWFLPGQRRLHYRGRLQDWPVYIEATFRRLGVTDLMLLGEQRAYHRQAIAVAQSMGIRVTVTDFGYLRPDWITLERDGMSGNSRFPRTAAQLQAYAANAPEFDATPQFTDSFTAMALGDLLFSFSNVLFCWLYPHYRRTDKRPNPFLYFPAMGLRLLTEARRQRRAAASLQQFLARSPRFFLFPMQLAHDFQMVAYSDDPSLHAALDRVIRSFAHHAPPDAALLCKCHPLDPGLVNWRRVVATLAMQYGVAERIHYLDGGSLDAMLAQASGVVTVNSTVGIQAMMASVPTTLLGRAMYDIPGLVHQGPLDGFWQAPQQPSSELLQPFLRAIAWHLHIRGVFFRQPGRAAAVRHAAARLRGDADVAPL